MVREGPQVKISYGLISENKKTIAVRGDGLRGATLVGRLRRPSHSGHPCFLRPCLPPSFLSRALSGSATS